MTTNETLRSVTRDPTGFIDETTLKRIVAKVRGAISSKDMTDALLAAALHRLVYTRVEYGDHLSSGLNFAPQETLTDRGNCADQALLLYALYRAADIETRIASAEQVDGSNLHAYVEVGLSASQAQSTIDELGSFYCDVGTIPIGRYWFIREGSTDYFIADPVSSQYIGDVAGLREMGYVGDDESMQIVRRYTLYDADNEPDVIVA
jgi:hypothetical protein